MGSVKRAVLAMVGLVAIASGCSESLLSGGATAAGPDADEAAWDSRFSGLAGQGGGAAGSPQVAGASTLTPEASAKLDRSLQLSRENTEARCQCTGCPAVSSSEADAVTLCVLAAFANAYDAAVDCQLDADIARLECMLAAGCDLDAIERCAEVSAIAQQGCPPLADATLSAAVRCSDGGLGAGAPVGTPTPPVSPTPVLSDPCEGDPRVITACTTRCSFMTENLACHGMDNPQEQACFDVCIAGADNRIRMAPDGTWPDPTCEDRIRCAECWGARDECAADKACMRVDPRIRCAICTDACDTTLPP